MDLGLQGKGFLVTGGSEGIGEAITRTLVEEGARVMIATRSEAPTLELVREIDPTQTRLGYILGDLSDSDHCQRVIQYTLHHFGRLDGLINNAGVNDGVGLSAGPQAFRASLDRNLGLAYDLCHYALPALKNSSGVILNVGSKVAMTGQGGTSGYAAAKAGLLGLTREWALDLAPMGIRVNAVIPSEVMTPMYRQWLEQTSSDPDSQEARIGQKIPLGRRFTLPEEIADTVVFICSPRASHMTGQWIVVDGGLLHLDSSQGDPNHLPK